MFEVTATRFHSATKTFAPLINSVVDDALLQTRPLAKVFSANRQCTLECQSTLISRRKGKIILRHDISKDVMHV